MSEYIRSGKRWAMSIRHGIAAGLVLACTIGSIKVMGLDLSSKGFSLDKEGGAIEVHAVHPDDKQTMDAVRQQLQEQARKGIPFATSAMQKYKKEIKYK